MIIRGLSVAAATVALGLFAFGAQAQQKAPEKAPAAKVAPKAKSACNQITDENACKANDTCSWIAALTDAKTGKQKRKAYCKTKPKAPPKKAKEAPKK
jgi:hypothetical protein